jgi:urocanate hydratase
MVGVSRRSWARNEHSIETTIEYNKKFQDQDHITLPFIASDELVEKTLKNFKNKEE